VNVVLLGPPGAGKGTQAKRIARRYALVRLSLGEMLRAAISAGSLREVEALVSEGELVPDRVAIGLVGQRLEQERAGCVLDGVPRNRAQADALDRLLDELRRPISVVLEFRIPDDLCVERLLQRGRHAGRPDDAPAVIARRLEIYRRETEPLVGYYASTGRRVVPIHAERSISEVWSEIRHVLAPLAAAERPPRSAEVSV
jgi:adenylate kinase